MRSLEGHGWIPSVPLEEALGIPQVDTRCLVIGETQAVQGARGPQRNARTCYPRRGSNCIFAGRPRGRQRVGVEGPMPASDLVSLAPAGAGRAPPAGCPGRSPSAGAAHPGSPRAVRCAMAVAAATAASASAT